MFFRANQMFGLCASGSSRFNETTHDRLIKPFVDSHQFYGHHVFVGSRCNRTWGVQNLLLKKCCEMWCFLSSLRASMWAAHSTCWPCTYQSDLRRKKKRKKRDASHSCSTKSPSGLTAAHFLTLFPGSWLHALYENVLFHLKSLFNWKALEEKGRNAAYGVMCGDLQEWVE